MLSLNDVYLPLPTDDILDFVQTNLNPELYCPWLRRSWPGFGLTKIGWPTGNRQDRPVRINRFYWPQGASRWAYGHFYCDARKTDEIRKIAFGEDGLSAPVELTLKMDSPGSKTEETLEAKVFLLPPTPISGVPLAEDNSVNNAYLLTVVDQRYHWWYKQTPAQDFGDEETWDSVFSMIDSALGITMTRDTINAAYLGVSPQFGLSYDVIPPLFDAAAMNVGQRVVVRYDGTVHTQNRQTAFDTLRDDVANHPDRNRIAGEDRLAARII